MIKPLKKVVIFLTILLCVTFSCQIFLLYQKKVEAKLTTFLYAKVEDSGVNLYRSPNSIGENIYFEIPQSYFVLLLSNYNNDFYKAQYQDVVGFVLKSQVFAINETPTTPFASATFYVFTTDGTTVMDTPTSLGKSLTTIEKYEEITYYGTTQGEEKTMGRGTTWYFGKTKQGVLGYFYAGLCEMNSDIPQNTETVTKATNPFGEDNNDYLYTLIDLSLGVKIVLLILVLLPAIFLLFLAFKPNFLCKPNVKTTKHLPKKHLHNNIKQIENYPDDNL